MNSQQNNLQQTYCNKIFLVVTEINFFYSHRYALIKKLSSMGWQFYIISYFKDAKPQDEKNINYIFIGSNREVFGILNLLKNKNLIWEHLSFYLVDERCVKIDHPQSNYGNLNNYFFYFLV